MGIIHGLMMHTLFTRLAILITVAILTSCSNGAQALQPAGIEGPAVEISDLLQSGDLEASIDTSTTSILQAINVRRAEAAAPALISHPVLDELASLRAADLTTRGYLTHEDPSSGETIVKRSLAELNYSGPAGELLFAAQDPLDSVPEKVIAAWFDDPMHKALLLEPTFRYCGIGLMGDGESWKISLVLTVALPEEVGS